MNKNNKRSTTSQQKRPLNKARKVVEVTPSTQETVPTGTATIAANGTPLDNLKDNMKKIDKGTMFEALKRVKGMKPESWRDPGAVRELTQNIAQDIGIKVDPKRMDAFMNAFSDVAKNAGDRGPKVNVEEIAKKYGGEQVDEKTIKEIKKFVK